MALIAASAGLCRTCQGLPRAGSGIAGLYNSEVDPVAPEFVITPMPTAHFGVGSTERLPAIVRALGAKAVVVVTDDALTSTSPLAMVTAVLADAGLPSRVFSGVHPNPGADQVAAGAAVVAEAAVSAAAVVEAAAVVATLRPSAPLASSVLADPVASAAPCYPCRFPALAVAPAPLAMPIALVAVGGGSAIDAAKGIAIAAVNPERGRDLDCRGRSASTTAIVPALPIVAVPTTAGTGAETNAFGVLADPATRRTYYVGHPSSMPAAAILDPVLTVGLAPRVTAATGLNALTNALESYLSLRPNPWSDGIALQAIRMIAANLPPAVEDGTNLAARSQMLLAAHLAGVAMASTGLGLCHAIGHSLGGRWNVAHGVALALVLPGVLRFNLPVRTQRLADVAFALGVADTGASADRNAAAAIQAVADLRGRVGLTELIADFGITEADFAQIAADALDDEVLASAPRPPSASDITALLAAWS